MNPQKRRNLKVVAPCLVFIGVMIGVVAYSPTLYRLFCAATGFGGTTQRVNTGSGADRFVVVQGVPVEWRIDARTASGCGHILIAPKLHVRRFLPSDAPTVISFTPQEVGEIGFNCAMGMMSWWSKITVLPKSSGKPEALLNDNPTKPNALKRAESTRHDNRHI